PEDEGLRLIYADWLEEHGESSRAELIRLEIEQHRLPWYDNRKADLEAHTAELRAAQLEWLGRLPQPDGVRLRFDGKGLISCVQGTVPAFCAHAEELFRVAPLHIAFFEPVNGPDLRALAASPYLAWLTELYLRGEGTTAGDAAVLAASPYLA